MAHGNHQQWHDEEQPGLSGITPSSGPRYAPTYQIPPREMSAVEHPMIITDVQKAIRTFGNNFNFPTILDHDSPQMSVPLYMRYDNPLARAVVSHNACSHNVVLKIVVPKRTGRKRKRGSDEPWQEDATGGLSSQQTPQLCSQRQLDHPRILRRKLQDNVGRYEVEAVGLVKNTHRYRALVDFQHTTVNSPFLTEFVDKIIPGDVSKLRQFSFNPGTAQPPKVEVVPPPVVSHMQLPYSYGFNQNPYVRVVDDGSGDGGPKIVNVTARSRTAGYFIASDVYPVPAAPSRPADMADPLMEVVLAEMARAFEERPIWTRRSLSNRVRGANPILTENIIKTAIPFVGYQFKGGPWRDAVVPYGLDPRTDPKYRFYQTLMFKTRTADEKHNASGPPLASRRKSDTAASRSQRQQHEPAATDSHIFDGQSFGTDGKVWQVCDMTEPLLASLFTNAAVRTECDDQTSGWFHHGLWAKARAIMKTKMLAVTFGRTQTDADFEDTLAVEDGTPPPTGSAGQLIAGTGNTRPVHINVPIPDLGLSDGEMAIVRGRKGSKFRAGLSQRKKRANAGFYRIPLMGKSTGGMVRLSAAAATESGLGSELEATDAGTTGAGSAGEATTGESVTPVRLSIEEILQDDDEDDSDSDDYDENSDSDSNSDSEDEEEENGVVYDEDEVDEDEVDEDEVDEGDDDENGLEEGEEEEDYMGIGSEAYLPLSGLESEPRRRVRFDLPPDDDNPLGSDGDEGEGPDQWEEEEADFVEYEEGDMVMVGEEEEGGDENESGGSGEEYDLEDDVEDNAEDNVEDNTEDDAADAEDLDGNEFAFADEDEGEDFASPED